MKYLNLSLVILSNIKNHCYNEYKCLDFIIYLVKIINSVNLCKDINSNFC